jgi:hypothetical protein
LCEQIGVDIDMVVGGTALIRIDGTSGGHRLRRRLPAGRRSLRYIGEPSRRHARPIAVQEILLIAKTSADALLGRRPSRKTVGIWGDVRGHRGHASPTMNVVALLPGGRSSGYDPAAEDHDGPGGDTPVVRTRRQARPGRRARDPHRQPAFGRRPGGRA